MTDQHQALHAYLERVTALRDQHERSLNHDELRQVARDVGLSNADLERAAEAAADHLQRARGFTDHRLLDEAITELREALVLVPDDPQILDQLARTYAARWERDKNPADLREAMATCKAVVAIDPEHATAYELLGRLSAQAKQSPKVKTSSRVVAIALTMILLMAVAAGAFLLVGKPSPPQPADIQAQNVGHAPVTKTLLNEPPAARSPQGDPVEASGNIEVRLVLASELPPVTLGHVHAELNTYPNGSFFKLNGLFANSSELEVHDVQARVQLLNDQGAPIGQPMPLAIKPSYMPALRPGDELAFRHQMATSADLASIEVLIDTIETRPAPSSYTESPTLEATITPGSGGVIPSLEVRERHFEMKTSELLDRRSMRLHLEIENTGDRALELVRLRIDLINEAGEVVDERLSYLVGSGYPAFAPGQTRMAAVIIADLAKSVADYRVNVVEWR
ncbi:DUF3426 domain-containing protein [Lujinxingia vulgaris]|uniref:DUF3426 domain-containing protein n=1 Tax=Lujinxingia vulgaris TaxID=2600176 RepID=A0A5C6XH62_9DELT|nr:FxLYD domain-containing protein [Lujinxingia vulgaris]TXD38245.1 DUF3426 domain-containing protein [Lujinxingia vulgaris]